MSGGPDSLALLLLAHAALPGRVEVATVDHQLRAESANEVAAVAKICWQLGIPHETLRVVVGSGNLQSEARAARYAALGEWLGRRRLEGLATAHHAEDQAETVLMRLNRESGLSGLAGIRAVTNVPGFDNRLVRPLLTWGKAELQVIVDTAGLEASRDPSNDDNTFDRVRIRHLLRQTEWLDQRAFARSAALIAEADFTLDRLALEELSDCGERGEHYTYYPYRRRPAEVAVMPLWLHIVREIAFEYRCPVGTADAATLLTNLRLGRKCNVGGLEGWVESRAGEIAWVFAPEAPRRAG